MSDESVHLVARYEAQVGRALKRAIWSRGLTLRSFAAILTAKGVPHSLEALSTKLYRGTFSAAFYVLCLDILAEASLAGPQR